MVRSSSSRGLQAPVDVARLGGDAADGDHQGGRGDRDAPATAGAEHPHRADRDGAAEALEPFGVEQKRQTSVRTGRGRLRKASVPRYRRSAADRDAGRSGSRG